MEMDNNLLTEMVERWRKETHTFHLLEGEMTITLKDVAMLTELPIDGDAIIESSQKPLNGWGQFISESLGINIPEEAQEGHRVPPLHKSMLLIPWLVRTVGELPEDATEAQIERYARIYLICLVGGFLFPNKSWWKYALYVASSSFGRLGRDWEKKLGICLFGDDIFGVVKVYGSKNKASGWSHVHPPTMGLGAPSYFRSDLPCQQLGSR
ncbi:unnamed protein product [Linum tenue]|uniref:Aminotransferase-like plant mobile domain-containing protein n=1 Tax=Linum tenue TaxID=586396 RepID=A0AAV0IXJ5_9ROSI|nr:unnamed protein product [Linum tenue]